MIKFLYLLSLTMMLAMPARAQERITIMAYNVENFFDAADDPRMPNGENLEVINTPEWVKAKAEAVARVIARFDRGTGPDILVMSELESAASLEAIKNALPTGSSYQTIVLFDADPNRPPPKPDRRGIKVGLLSKLPLAPASLPSTHPVDLTGEAQCKDQDGTPGSTRDLLAVTLKLPDQSDITVIVGHLPSGRNPRVCREIAAKTAAGLASDLPSDRTVIAAGDFNFNCANEEQVALKASLPGWLIPSEINNGCRADGTQYFGRDKTWSYLDIFAQKPSSARWALDMRSFHVVLTDFEQLFWDQGENVLRPKKFRYNQAAGRGSGTSDHWPIGIDLVKQ